MRNTCRTGLASLVLGLIAFPSLAGLPASMDRVPTDAVVVASVRNMQAFVTNVEQLRRAVPGAGELPMVMIRDLLGTDGLNPAGSISLALMAPPGGEIDFDDDEGPMVMIVPVNDADAFVRALGGTPGPLAEIEINGSPGFVKPLGGGYVAMSPIRELVQNFAGTPGQTAAHNAALGRVGQRVAHNADTVILANIPALRPQMEQGLEGMKQQMQFFAMMAGQDAAQVQHQFQLVETVAAGFLRDATVGLVGFQFGDAGVHIDLAANFKEGSEVGGFFTQPGRARANLDRIPAMPFLFAGSFDVSSPGLQKIVTNILDHAAAGNQAQPDALNPAALMQGVDGMSFILGTTPAVLGGLFSNTAYFYNVKDPAAYETRFENMMNELNGRKVEGITYRTSFARNAVQIEGRGVSSYTMSMAPDPNDPAAMQTQQMMMLMFGPSMGANGFFANVNGGAVQTMSQNTPLMGQLLRTAQNGNGLANDANLRPVAARLPDNPSFEIYIGIGSILQTVQGFMAMMGGGMDIQIPANLAPVAIGGTTDANGFHARVVLPADVIRTIANLAEEFGGGDDDFQPAPAGRPRF